MSIGSVGSRGMPIDDLAGQGPSENAGGGKQTHGSASTGAVNTANLDAVKNNQTPSGVATSKPSGGSNQEKTVETGAQNHLKEMTLSGSIMRDKLVGTLAQTIPAATGGGGSGKPTNPAADGSVRFNPLHTGSSPTGIIEPEDLAGKGIIQNSRLADSGKTLENEVIPTDWKTLARNPSGEKTGQPGPFGNGPWEAKFNPAGQAGAETRGLENDADRGGVDKLFDVFNPTLNEATAEKFAYSPTRQTDEGRAGVDKLFDVFNPASRDVRSSNTEYQENIVGAPGTPSDSLGQPGPIADAVRKATSKQEG